MALVATGGCNNATTRLRQNPTVAAALPPEIRQKIERGIIEPGFTPEMVYLALGRPTVPANADVALTRDGTWIYRDFNRNDRDFIRAGFRRRVVFDPVRRGDVIITEPVDPRLFPHLLEHSLHVTFREGRVVDIQRTTL
ncbi:MAG: hypothetical protein HY736_02635 [Verrucomicrobia bacterium]|nr:hypothetical protein [Verrucomicrobiota bacterium]